MGSGAGAKNKNNDKGNVGKVIGCNSGLRRRNVKRKEDNYKCRQVR